MVRKLCIALLFTICYLLFTPVVVRASSIQAYADYLHESDVYRAKYNEFSIAKNEFQKFKTLASEATAITNTKEMLSARSLLLRAYLLLLTEKINETPTLTDADRQLYQSLISNEVSFLQTHSQFVGSVSTIKDAIKGSEQLENHYVILQTSIRQIIIGLTVAKLTSYSNTYSNLMVMEKSLLDSGRNEATVDRQNILDRWFQRISDKRTLFTQKVDSINQAKALLKGNKLTDIETKYADILRQTISAHQELVEGTSYMGELATAIKYKE